MTGIFADTSENRSDFSTPAPADPLLASELVTEIEFLAARAVSIGTARANSMLAPLDLKVRSYSVLALACTSEAPSQRELADFLCLVPSQIVAIVDALEQRGLVERIGDRNDRRAKAIRATASGKKLYKNASKAVREAEAISLEALTVDEYDQLRGLLLRIAFAPAG